MPRHGCRGFSFGRASGRPFVIDKCWFGLMIEFGQVGTVVALVCTMRKPQLLTLGVTVGAAVVAAVFAGCGAESASGSGASPGGDGNVGLGGAQDIGQFRGYLDRNEIPTAASLDANGFFSEHYIAPETAACGNVICATAQTSSQPDWFENQRHSIVRVALSTVVDPAMYKRKPLNLVVVVDRSGSMQADNRMEKVKTGLRLLIQKLQPVDRVALVSFDDYARVDVSFTDSEDRQRLIAAVDRLQPGGSTNIYDGLAVGFAQFGKGSFNERQNRVILLSDGQATSGITSTPAIIGMAESKVATGIGLSTVGVGNSFDAALMRGLAERGAGNFYFAENATAVSEIFTQELDYFIEPLALDVELGVAANQGFALGEAVGVNYWQHDGAGQVGRVKIPAVFLASRSSEAPGQGRRGGGGAVFIHLIDSRTANAVDEAAATVTLSYRLPNGSQVVTQTVAIAPPVPVDAPSLGFFASHDAMKQAAPMYHVFRGLRLATNVASSDIHCALTTLLTLREQAQAFVTEHPDFDLTADLALVDKFIAVLKARGAVARELPNEGAASCYQTTCVDDECDCDASSCASTIVDAPDYGDEYGESVQSNNACSAGAAPTTLAPVLAAMLAMLVARRRRYAN